MRPDDLLTAEEARRMLQISRRKMAQLIASGEMHTQPRPADKRFKLIRRAELAGFGPFSKIAA